MSDYGTLVKPGTLHLERVLPGPIERVWEYLTDGDKRGTWLAAGPMEYRVGGSVELVFHNNSLSRADDPAPEKYADVEGLRMLGRVTRFDPPHALSYTWGEPDYEESEVHFDLSEQGDQVLLVITHERLGDDPAMLIGVASGWHAHTELLRHLLGGTKAPSYWKTQARLEREYGDRLKV